MITNSQNIRNNDWSDYYKRDVCFGVGINPDLPLTICGQQPEPQKSWNENTEKYDGKVNGYGYWVTQAVKDNQGNIWLQNPVMVIVDGSQPLDFKFGQEVVFQGLAGYYSRRKYKYMFRAKGIKANA